MSTKIGYSATSALTPTHRSTLAIAKARVYGSEQVQFQKGTDIEINCALLNSRPFPENYLTLELARHAARSLPLADYSRVLFLDIESHNAGKQWDMPIEEFFRLGQYAWGLDGPVVITTDLDQVLAAMNHATTVVAHNGHAFDFSVLLGNAALDWTFAGRLFDTYVHANMVFPAPYSYTDRGGHTYFGAAAPSTAMKWLSLDNLGFQLGAGAKEGDLKALAKKYNPKGTLVRDLDYGLIPTDDPDFLAYAEQDVVLLREVFLALMQARPLEPYDTRVQQIAAINAQITRNGITVDQTLAAERIAEAQVKKDDVLATLQAQYGFPTEGAMPWRSKVGKEAIFNILADAGINAHTHPDWPKTKTGNLSLGGDALLEVTAGTEVAALGESLAQLQGQRPLAQQAMDYVKGDGKVHPDISAIQRSGRSSITKPGMTTWSNNGDKAYEKDYITASPGNVLIEFDLSNADQRIVAALSGDMEYLKRFEPGVDGHEINGRIMFEDKYDEDPKFYRNAAKAPGHAITYGAGVNRLVATTGLPESDIQRFVDGFFDLYSDLAAWQAKVRKEGEVGWIINRWGRRMVIDKVYDADRGEWKSRAWTQAPALHGQSGTTEVLMDGLIRMYEVDKRLILWLACTIHDALLVDVPEAEEVYVREQVALCMEQTIDGVPFPVSSGPAGRTWHEAAH